MRLKRKGPRVTVPSPRRALAWDGYSFGQTEILPRVLQGIVPFVAAAQKVEALKHFTFPTSLVESTVYCGSVTSNLEVLRSSKICYSLFNDTADTVKRIALV